MTVNRNKNIGNEQDRIVIFGAGPAGLTAGFELVRNSQSVLILESDKEYVGGIARTASHKNFKFDIGGHRFFTKSEKVKELWREILEHEFWKYGCHFEGFGHRTCRHRWRG